MDVSIPKGLSLWQSLVFIFLIAVPIFLIVVFFVSNAVIYQEYMQDLVQNSYLVWVVAISYGIYFVAINFIFSKIGKKQMKP